MRVKYKDGRDILTFEFSERKPELEEDVLVIDKYENHLWKVNKLTQQIFYVQFRNASVEFGDVWLNELLGAQLLSDHMKTNPETFSDILLPGQEGFSSPLMTTGLF